MQIIRFFSKTNLVRLVTALAVPLLTGALSALASMNSMEVFRTLKQPPLSPPAVLFPIVWTILYLLMGLSFYFIQNTDTSKELFSDARALYHYQLTVNFLWPVFFFRFGWYLFSLFWLLLLWGLVLAMLRCFHKIKPLSAFLNLPYLLWLTFAAYLNFGIWWLNR